MQLPSRKHHLYKTKKAFRDNRTEGYVATISERIGLRATTRTQGILATFSGHIFRARGEPDEEEAVFTNQRLLRAASIRSAHSPTCLDICTQVALAVSAFQRSPAHQELLLGESGERRPPRPREGPQHRAYLPLTVGLHQLAERGVPLDFELNHGAVLSRYFQVDVVVFRFHTFLDKGTRRKWVPRAAGGTALRASPRRCLN